MIITNRSMLQHSDARFPISQPAVSELSSRVFRRVNTKQQHWPISNLQLTVLYPHHLVTVVSARLSSRWTDVQRTL